MAIRSSKQRDCRVSGLVQQAHALGPQKRRSYVALLSRPVMLVVIPNFSKHDFITHKY